MKIVSVGQLVKLSIQYILDTGNCFKKWYCPS